MKSTPKITLDHNAIINVLDHTAENPTSVTDLQEIMRHANGGRVSVAITSKAEIDLRKDKEPERLNAMLSALSFFDVVGGVPLTERDQKVRDEIQRIIAPGFEQNGRISDNTTNDIDHLYAHHINERDIFVTDDKGILKKFSALKKGLGIEVLSPQECRQRLESAEIKESTAQPEVGVQPTYSNSAEDGHRISSRQKRLEELRSGPAFSRLKEMSAVFKLINDTICGTAERYAKTLGEGFGTKQGDFLNDFDHSRFQNRIGVLNLLSQTKEIWPLISAEIIKDEVVIEANENGKKVELLRAPYPGFNQTQELSKRLGQYFDDHLGQLQ